MPGALFRHGLRVCNQLPVLRGSGAEPDAVDRRAGRAVARDPEQRHRRSGIRDRSHITDHIICVRRGPAERIDDPGKPSVYIVGVVMFPPGTVAFVQATAFVPVR